MTTMTDGRKGRSNVPSRILQRYDKDGDGKLNAGERAAFEKARRQRRRGRDQPAVTADGWHGPHRRD